MKPGFDYKRLLIRLCEQDQVEITTLGEPPVSDSVAGLACPSCGELETGVRKVNDAEVELSGGNGGDETVDALGELIDLAVCTACGAEFEVAPPSPAGEIVGAVLGERQRVLRRLGNVPLRESAAIAYAISK